ncbi:class I SAM-dependent methyltransferase [Salirhabdus sp. Marseille-P4669]|uniref:class I SAM-dependent methyltransferase n=1 Tax=Salirhabdus sp. Marseille-P4669 TaxID=2042310 RepID=UPI000C7C6E7E|nr:class I SAM-dependent methyltransferase [Salirhabdus sp. Marseille-P4669]
MSHIVNYYSQFDEWGRLDREPIEFLVNWEYIKKYLPESGFILDNGAGPGKYAMRLAQEGYYITLADVTPKLVNVAKEKALELKLDKQFDGFYELDARNLSSLEDGQFDATLMLGPMYHLQDQKSRLQAVQELNRVTKKDGVVFVAFMSRIRHIFTSLLNPEHWKPNDNMDTIQTFLETGCFNHADDGRFTGAYYFNMEDIKPFMESQGFESLELLGSNVGAVLNQESWDYWKNKGEEERVTKFIIEKATDSSLLGISTHLLYIGRKI